MYLWGLQPDTAAVWTCRDFVDTRGKFRACTSVAQAVREQFFIIRCVREYISSVLCLWCFADGLCRQQRHTPDS